MNDYKIYCEYNHPVYKNRREVCLSDLTEDQSKRVMEMLKYCAVGHCGFAAKSYLEREVDAL